MDISDTKDRGSDAEPSSQDDHLAALGYKTQLRRNRSTFTLLYQSLAIAAIPYGFGAPLMSAVYGGGQLSMFLGWMVVLVVDECVAISLAELASRYPTSAGPYYWSFQVANRRVRTVLSFVTGWAWLVGNWTITLSVNFGFALLLASSVALYHPDYEWKPWQLLLIFYGLCLVTCVIVAYGNRFLPSVDTFCAAFTAVTIVVTLLCLSIKADAGRNSAKDTLGSFNPSLSGWGDFSFFIGLLPSAYTFSAIGMIASMAEECDDPAVKLPRALALCVPVGGLAGLFFVIPICATLPALSDILDAPLGQALPHVYLKVMGSAGPAMVLVVLIMVITLFCSISITVTASRCTWAFARDRAMPLSRLWSQVDERHGVPMYSLALTTVVQMLLGLIYLGSEAAFNGFVSVGLIGLAVSYGIPIALSMLHGRKGVNTARWSMGGTMGWAVNLVALAWIAFEVVLFSLPTKIPVTEVTMNYAIVVFAGFMLLSALWYGVHAHKVYRGPPESDGLGDGQVDGPTDRPVVKA